MDHDWIRGALGGLMIGTAAAAFLLINGRIMGVSGIFGGVIDGTERIRRTENLSFIVGLITVPALFALRSDASTHLTANLWLVITAGFLVGLGTRLANGCTSGHGVCGIARLSLRSLVATAVFLVAGAVTMVVLRHVLMLI